MTLTIGVVGGWIALNAALAIVLFNRRDRPKTRARLLAWVMKDERRRHRSAAVPNAR